MMLATYTAEDTRTLDALAIEQCKIPGIVLMRRAAKAALARILETWPEPTALTVLCGAGNNAGDGYLLAGLAYEKGISTRVYWLCEPTRLKGDAAIAFKWCVDRMVPTERYTAQSEIVDGVIVDAMLGTGLSGEVRDAYRSAIIRINEFPLPVAALDLPSGLSADTGAESGVAIEADLTVTFIARKRGLYTAAGRHCSGKIQFEDLGVPMSVYDLVPSRVNLLDIQELLDRLPRRNENSHKGEFGHLLVVGGDTGMGGAIAMAAIAASRCGVGLTSVASRAEHAAALMARQPEIMSNQVSSGQDLEFLFSTRNYSAVVIGPGLGQSAWSEQLMQKIQEQRLPQLLDADAINLLCRQKISPRQDRVMTPHPGEAARVLGCSTRDIQSDRFAAIRSIQQLCGGVIVLKGAGTLIDDGETIDICPYGNPGMATAGMGDVLSGVIGSFLAQGISALEAARLGVCLHSLAADFISERCGTIGLMATDLIPVIRALLNRNEPKSLLWCPHLLWCPQ